MDEVRVPRPRGVGVGNRKLKIGVPAHLIVRIDVIAATRPDRPTRSNLIAEAMAEYLERREESYS